MSNQFTFRIDQLARTNNPEFGLDSMLYSIEYPDNLQTFYEAQDEIQRMLSEIHMTLTSTMRSSDKIRVVFFHKDFFTCIDLPFLKKSDFTVKLLVESFENVIQSYKDIIINYNNSFTANVQIQRMPSGTGRRCISLIKKRAPYVKKVKINNNILDSNVILPDIQLLCNNKNSIINVINNDNMCLLRAVLIAIRFSEKCDDRFKLCETQQHGN
jgi:hypothetical protein